MKRAALVILMPLIMLLPIGCPVSAGGGPGDTVDAATGGEVKQQDDLFVPQADGSYSFSTNDSAYWGPDGYTLWSMSLLVQEPFTQRDVTLVKISGNAYAGYGFIFCQYAVSGAPQQETMLVVMINTEGQYSVGEATGSEYTSYTSPIWIQGLSLNTGYGISNTAKVTRDQSGLFTLFLNGTQVMTFHDGRIPVQTGGGNGYLTVISPQDSFPGSPVSVSYRDN